MVALGHAFTHRVHACSTTCPLQHLDSCNNTHGSLTDSKIELHGKGGCAGSVGRLFRKCSDKPTQMRGPLGVRQSTGSVASWEGVLKKKDVGEHASIRMIVECCWNEWIYRPESPHAPKSPHVLIEHVGWLWDEQFVPGQCYCGMTATEAATIASTANPRVSGCMCSVLLGYLKGHRVKLVEVERWQPNCVENAGFFVVKRLIFKTKTLLIELYVLDIIL